MLQLLESIFLYDYFRKKKTNNFFSSSSFFFFFPKLWFSWKNSIYLLFSSESAALCPGSPVRGRRAAVVVTPKPGGGKAPGFSWGDQGNSQGPIPDTSPSGLGWAASAGVALELADLPLPAGLSVCCLLPVLSPPTRRPVRSSLERL